LRHSGIKVRVFDLLLILLLLAAVLAATRLDHVLAPDIVPLAQVAVFSAAALLLTASALRRGLARGARLAYTDELTGLNNRRYFTEMLADHLFDNRGRDRHPALLLLDLDRFKVVNDTLGHPAGDELLKVVATRLRASVPAGSFVARLGGDEFAVIASVHDEGEASEIAASILTGINQPVTVHAHEIWPNASIGIALLGATRIPPGELLSMADVALYQAKGRGRGQAFLFDSNARLPSLSKLSMESELHLALKQDQFEMLYQPVVDLKSREVVGAEALVRWNHPSLGLLTPDTFLSLADETGIGHALGGWIIDEVTGQSSTWRQLFGERLSVSINISPAEFQNVEFIYSLGRLVRDGNVAVTGLNFEITESSLIAEDSLTRDTMAELRRLGFKVAIDDFGVGFSSLNYLQTNRMDVLKLDPAFVRGDDTNPRTFRIARSIVDLAHSLGMVVVAEGIETMEQYQRMLQADCDQGQGFFFARPMHAQELTELLANAELKLPLQTFVERRRRSRPWSRRKEDVETQDGEDLREQRGA
jgi:diguanylate cyclase (GGDEF)-like protein